MRAEARFTVHVVDLKTVLDLATRDGFKHGPMQKQIAERFPMQSRIAFPREMKRAENRVSHFS